MIAYMQKLGRIKGRKMKKSEIEVISPTTTVEAIEKALDVPAIDPIVLSVANEYLSGKPITQIAETFDLSEDRVAAIIERRGQVLY